jgi:FkbM family methyltransferase
MRESLEMDDLLFLLRVYCGHGDGTRADLVDFPDKQPHTTILEIGANKGFSLVPYFSLWGDFGDTLVKTVAHRRPYAGHAAGKLTVHAFEPLSSTFAVLKRVADHFGPIGMHSLSVHNLAVSNFTADVIDIAAPNTEEATELAGLSLGSGAGKGHAPSAKGLVERVRVETVDGLVQRLGVGRVIHMKVDTEGNDGRVIYGADRTLHAGAIVTATLEYDRRAWHSVFGTPLREVVRFLHARGYDAFFVSNSRLIKLSPVDWQPFYEDTAWANLWISLRASACANKVITAFAAKTDDIPATCYQLS